MNRTQAALHALPSDLINKLCRSKVTRLSVKRTAPRLPRQYDAWLLVHHRYSPLCPPFSSFSVLCGHFFFSSSKCTRLEGKKKMISFSFDSGSDFCCCNKSGASNPCCHFLCIPLFPSLCLLRLTCQMCALFLVFNKKQTDLCSCGNYLGDPGTEQPIQFS